LSLLWVAEAVVGHDPARGRALFAEAERVARSIDSQAWALAFVASAVVGHDPVEAERIARSITIPFPRKQANWRAVRKLSPLEKAAFERRQDSRRQAWHDQEAIVPLVPTPRATPSGVPDRGAAVEPAAEAGEVAALLEQLATDIAGQAGLGRVPGYMGCHRNTAEPGPWLTTSSWRLLCTRTA
jgi:hypothetical protein